MISVRGFLYGYFYLTSRAATRRSVLLCRRLAGTSFALPGLPLLDGAQQRLFALRGLSSDVRSAATGRGAVGTGPCALRRRGCGGLGAAGSGFRPSRVAVVVKTTRYEFEQQRYRYAGLSEEDLKQLVSGRGTAVPAFSGAAAGAARPVCGDGAVRGNVEE